MDTVNDILLDRLIRHQVGLYRLGTQTANDLSAILSESDPKIVSLIEGLSATSTPGEVERVLRSIERRNSRAYDAVLVALTAAMVEVAKYEVGFQTRLLDNVLGGEVRRQTGLVAPSVSRLTRTVSEHPIDGAKLREYVAGTSSGRYTRMRDVIRREYSRGGASVSGAIKSAIVGTSSAKYADGVFGLSHRSLEQIVRTIQSGVISAARDLLYNENDHLFSGLIWASVLDTRTSDICQNLDGQVLPLDRGPRPPAHRNCRSATSPIVRSWRALGLENLSPELKEMLDGKPPSKMTYPQWLAKQSASVQDEVLGPTRGRMYRKGEVTFDRFTDSRGRRYTLDELQAREGL